MPVGAVSADGPQKGYNMTREEIFEALDEVFQEVFDDDSIHVSDTTTAEDIDGWDSLIHIDLMMAVEDRFEVTFNVGEIGSMKNVGQMVDMIEEKMAQ